MFLKNEVCVEWTMREKQTKKGARRNLGEANVPIESPRQHEKWASWPLFVVIISLVEGMWCGNCVRNGRWLLYLLLLTFGWRHETKISEVSCESTCDESNVSSWTVVMISSTKLPSYWLLIGDAMADDKKDRDNWIPWRKKSFLCTDIADDEDTN